jgi:hypothetical protein
MLAVCLLLAAVPGLDLAEFEGSGFTVRDGAASSEGAARHPALWHRTFRLPEGAVYLGFRARAVAPPEEKADGRLLAVLEAAAREMLPMQVRAEGRWVGATRLRPGEQEYRFVLEGHEGRRVRLAFADLDARPGCYLVASGLALLSRDEANARELEASLGEAMARARMPRFRRYESRHWLAYGNASLSFVRQRLEECEKMHAAFFRHFRSKGFELSEPSEKLLAVVCGKQEWFEAVLGARLGPAVTGVYQPGLNRLVVYDYGTNASFEDARRSADELLRGARSDLERHGLSIALGRSLRERREDVNLGTVMHEASHQLAFTSGLLSRQGDVPAWLAEGMAAYCEAVSGGAWQGMGGHNPERAAELARAEGKLLAVRDLVSSDDWLRKAGTAREAALGYAQSWVLFSTLLEERPRQLKAYLEQIRGRRGPDHRLTDFVEAFGNLKKVEDRHAERARSLARRR